MVQTVTGRIDPGLLGKTLMHEHMYVVFPGAEFDPFYRMPREQIVAECVRKLVDLKEYGVTTIVDPTPIELGRDVTLLREISERAQTYIICATGFYFEAAGLPLYWRARTVEEISELLIEEINNGIGGSSVRPGVIKCGSGAGAITPLEKKFLEAACVAHKHTGIPILTHTQDGTCGPEQAQFFCEHGVLSSKCLIGHCCGNSDPRYHATVVDQGAYIGFDRCGYSNLMPDADRADGVARLVRGGKLDRVMLSQDKPFVWAGRYPLFGTPKERQEFDRLRACGEWPVHPRQLFTEFLPLLRERGVSDDQIDEMLIGNPRRYFE
jgi:phosphotriesterase-related protein